MFCHEELVGSLEMLRKFSLRLTGNVPDGEDLLQSTILRALEKKHLFEPGTNLASWMSRIMFNLFVSQYRRRVKFETKYDPEEFIEKRSVNAAQEAIVEVSEVEQAMTRLSPDQRNILTLICAQGHKYEETASILGVPVGTVRSRLARARGNLQAIMEQPIPKAKKNPALKRASVHGAPVMPAEPAPGAAPTATPSRAA